MYLPVGTDYSFHIASFKVYLAMPMDKGAFNVYMGFLFWCVVFGVSVFFVLFSNYLLVIKERQKYKEENLFFWTTAI